MAKERCPKCSTPIPAPTMFHGLHGKAHKHSNRYCPDCNRPLVWFSEGPLAGAWRIDDGIAHLPRLLPGPLRPAA